MNHKERVLGALHLGNLDKVPSFYWDTLEFGDKMMKHLGFNNRDQLLEYLDVDFRWVEPEYIGDPLISDNGRHKKDIWGVGYSKVGESGFEYWQADTFPLEGITDPECLNDYKWPDISLFDFSSLEEQLIRYKDYAIMTAPGYTSPGLFRIIKRLIGPDTFTKVMMDNPKLFKALCWKVMTFYEAFLKMFFDVVGDKLDFIRIADNFGAEDGLTISTYVWDLYISPAFEVFTAEARKHGAHFYMHSSGGVRKLLPQFISAGVEVLDPIQIKAFGMSPDGLKKDFGKIITFCGAFDEENLLRTGTPDEVRKGVCDLLDLMAPGGRFILGPSDKIKIETPVENVIAMYEAVRDWKY